MQQEARDISPHLNCIARRAGSYCSTDLQCSNDKLGVKGNKELFVDTQPYKLHVNVVRYTFSIALINFIFN